MIWKPGDRAIVVGRPIHGSEMAGEIVFIKSSAYMLECFHVVDIEPLGSYKRVDVKYLKPIDDYDGHEKTTWDKLPLECRPKELVRVEI